MKSDRSFKQIKSKHHIKRQYNSPTIASSLSQKTLWTKSYKNQPFPGEIKRRLIGRQFHFQDFSDQEQNNTAVVMEEQQNEVLQKKKSILSHFKPINDRGEFTGNRSRIKSQKKYDMSNQRCRSVQSLKLPQVQQQKKQQDQLQRLKLSKLSQFIDKNEFNQRGDSNSHTDRSRQSLELNHYSSVLPEKIMENQAEQTKSEKLRGQKSIINTQIDKIVVDQIDQKKRKKEQPAFQLTIEQQHNQQQTTQNMEKFILSLSKLQIQTQYLNRDELYLINNNRQQSNQKEPNEQQCRQYEYQETIQEKNQ